MREMRGACVDKSVANRNDFLGPCLHLDDAELVLILLDVKGL